VYTQNICALIIFLIHKLNSIHMNVCIIFHSHQILLWTSFRTLSFSYLYLKLFYHFHWTHHFILDCFYLLIPVFIILFWANFNISISFLWLFEINFFEKLNFLPFVTNYCLINRESFDFYLRFAHTLIYCLQFHHQKWLPWIHLLNMI
jgi:hypothetical protein